MNNNKMLFQNNMYHIIPTQKLRETPNVLFNNVPIVKGLCAIDYVDHGKNAKSPAIKDYKKDDLWYMHPYQEDNLLVLHGKRFVNLYNKANGIIDFEITSTYVKNLTSNEILFEGMCIFGWSAFVFHRVNSGEEGSKSLNYAVHLDGFDIKNNFF